MEPGHPCNRCGGRGHRDRPWIRDPDRVDRARGTGGMAGLPEASPEVRPRHPVGYGLAPLGQPGEPVSGLLGEWQPDRELAARSGVSHGDRALVRLHDASGDGEPEPGMVTVRPGGSSRLSPKREVEDTTEDRLGYPSALVGHGNIGFDTVNPGLHPNRPITRGVLDGVVQKVPKYPGYFGRRQLQLRAGSVELPFDSDASGSSRWSSSRHRIRDEVRQRNAFQLQA